MDMPDWLPALLLALGIPAVLGTVIVVGTVVEWVVRPWRAGGAYRKPTNKEDA